MIKCTTRSDITVEALYHMEEGDKGRFTKLISKTMGKPLIAIVNIWFAED
jgi:hypothetical protein